MKEQFLLLLPILFPVIAGMVLLISKLEDREKRQKYVASVVILNAIFVLLVLYFGSKDAFVLHKFSQKLSLILHIDGMSMVFGTMVSILWVITTFYAFEYMKHEGMETKFFSFFTMTFGIVVGIAFSGNMLTLYLFYEFLTLVTLPLVMHNSDGKTRYAGRIYLIYMMGGASLAFIGLVFLVIYGNSLDFVMGGILNTELAAKDEEMLHIVYLLAFFGFGVKAAVLPCYYWLPTAAVAPTPVTALLHAVAVVKAGVFAIIRLTYYNFGTEFLRGTWTQNVILVMTALTIVFGSTMALRTPHIKRRYGYSTISNLSYILFGIALMTPAGLSAGLLHMIYHAVLKITLFFCAGAILYQNHREYAYEIEGFGTKMPMIFFSMTVVSIGMAGIPPFAGFHSKWALGTAAVATENPVAYLGIAALILSALLTVLYLFSLVIKAYFPVKKQYPTWYYDGVADPNRLMTIPLLVLSMISVVIGLYPKPFLQVFDAISQGLL